MFQYEVVQDGLTVEELLRTKWRLGKKLVHELRMAKAVTFEDGTPVLWNDPLKQGTIIKFTFDVPSSSYVTNKPL